MKNICLIYEYDGNEFYGNQRQKDKITVSGLIERIFKEIFDEDIHLINSGRTDKGVHAKMQVSNFFMKKDIEKRIIKYQIEKRSNKSIIVNEILEVDKDFNSRYDVKSRTYEYILTNKVNPFNRKYVTEVDYDIDIDRLNNILKSYLGEHDFSYFSKKDKDDDKKSKKRMIYNINVIKKDENIHVYIEGNAFLKTQVRIMMGTALKIYEKKLDDFFIKRALIGLEKDSKKYIAKENGLYLFEVKVNFK